jgi:hypothetical protein
LAASALLLAGCTESTLTTGGPGEDVGPELRDRPAYDPEGDRPVEPEDDAGIPSDRCCIMVPAGETEVSIARDGSRDMGVYLFSLNSGEPMADQTITWTVEGDTSGGARIGAGMTLTGLEGLAETRLEAGTLPTTVTVTASYPGANDVEFTVSVLDVPVGTLDVVVSHPSASIYDVSPIDVRLYRPAVLRCRDLIPGSHLAEYVLEVEITNTSERARFENVVAGENFTAVATGFGDLGEIAAQGCLDDVFVEADETKQVEIVLGLLPLNPVGEYDVRSYWDFTEALLETGSVGAIIVDILDLFENPGEQILDYIMDAIGYFVSGIVSDVVEIFLDVTGLDDLIADWINDLINESTTLRQFFSIGCDLRRMVTRLQVISVLSIGKLGSDFEVFGVDTWIGLGICDFTPNPDFEVGMCDEAPDCERIEIILDTFDLGLLRGEWTGRVLSYDRLDIDRHAVDFNYGRLILFVLENYIFPFLTGDPPPVSLEDVVFSIIDCEGMAESITGSDGEICVVGCITDDDIAGFCESAVGLVFGTLFEGFVSSLSFDSVIELRGQVTLVNTDTDLDVDALENGLYTGTINVNGSSSPFEAEFSGQRQEE